jgi:hypothetical protein
MPRHPATLPQPKGAIKPHVWRDGRQYFSMPELARRRGITRQAASKWARRPGREHLTIRIGSHTYAEDVRTTS